MSKVKKEKSKRSFTAWEQGNRREFECAGQGNGGVYEGV